MRHDRPGFFERLLGAATHDGECAILGALLTTRNRRIDKSLFAGASGLGQAFGNPRRCRRVVNQDGALWSVCDDSLVAFKYFDQIFVSANTGYDKICVSDSERDRITGGA